MKQIIKLNSFTAGVLSPDVYWRDDTQDYAKGGFTVGENLQVDLRGGFRKRNGTRHVSKCINPAVPSKNIRYQYSSTVAYNLEFSDYKISLYLNDAQVTDLSKTISAIDITGQVTITSAAHTLNTGDRVYISGVVGTTQINNVSTFYIVGNVTTDTFELKYHTGVAVYDPPWDSYDSGGVVTRIQTIVSPYTLANLENIYYFQDNNYLYLLHPTIAPYRLFRDATNTFTLELIDFDLVPTYQYGDSPNLTLSLSATSGTPTATLSGAGFFLANDIGRQIHELDGNGKGIITAVTDANTATLSVISTFSTTSYVAYTWKLDLSPIAELHFDRAATLGGLIKVYAGIIQTVDPNEDADQIGAGLGVVDGTNGLELNPPLTSGSHTGYAIRFDDNLATVGAAVSVGDAITVADFAVAPGMNKRKFRVTHLATRSGSSNAVAFLDTKISGIDSAAANIYELQDIYGKPVSSSKVTGSPIGGQVYLTSDQTNGGNNFISTDTFRSGDVGKYLLANGGVLKIASVNSAAEITAIVLKELNTADTTTSWSLETPIWNSNDGYPTVGAIHNQRLFLMGSVGFPRKVWASTIADYLNFGVGPDQEDSLELDLVAPEAFRISWASTKLDLVVGTTCGEFVISSGSTSASLDATHNSAVLQTHYGSKLQIPLAINEEILFVQNSGKKIRPFLYQNQFDQDVGNDLLIMGRPYFERGIKKIVYASEPNSLLAVVTHDNRLLIAAYDRKQKTCAWSEWITDGEVTDIETVSNDGIDQFWLTVKRHVSDSYEHNIEVLNYTNGVIDTDIFVDAALTYSIPISIESLSINDTTLTITTVTNHGLVEGDEIRIKGLEPAYSGDIDTNLDPMTDINGHIYTVESGASGDTLEIELDKEYDLPKQGTGTIYKVVNEVSGLQHLEGKQVKARLDNTVQGLTTVTDGKITLVSGAAEVVVGLPYEEIADTLPVKFSQGMGDMIGQPVRWISPLVYVVDSTIPTLDGNEELPDRMQDSEMDNGNPLYTGFCRFGNLEYKNTNTMSIRNSDPLPLYIIGVAGSIESGVNS